MNNPPVLKKCYTRFERRCRHEIPTTISRPNAATPARTFRQAEKARNVAVVAGRDGSADRMGVTTGWSSWPWPEKTIVLPRFPQHLFRDYMHREELDQVDGDPDEDVTSEFPQGSVPSTKRTIDTAEKAAIWNDAIQTAIDELEPIESNLRALFLEEDSFRSELIKQLDAGAEIPEDLEEEP